MLGAPVAAPPGMGPAGPAAAVFGTRAVLGATAAPAVLITFATLPVPSVRRIRGDGSPAEQNQRPSGSQTAREEGETATTR
ncbi:hypothetical protein GCM10010140_22480 [Streptosporangium pseudovulgare]|uniref:MFS transporter n=1 Tax=Streptosporangium pseudovulgare TaxID=35765 RepID=A0ABQ2QQ86_9ACTN|nr:hypothetical protein GCM10010140_22480 [Streptosporangium pseudovulgare]